MPCKRRAALPSHHGLALLCVALCIAAAPTAHAGRDDCQEYTEPPLRKWIMNDEEVCLGTENGLNVINLRDLSHYKRLARSFIHCKRIIGNLELTHVTPQDLLDDCDYVRANGTVTRVQRPPFWFLSELEEVTGYLLVFNVFLERITLPKLKIIWGGKLFRGNALDVYGLDYLQVLSLPSLRAVENGNIHVHPSPNLCYIHRSVDFAELIGVDAGKRVVVEKSKVHPECAQVKCHPRCGGGPCFGPNADDCQIVYRQNCGACASGACYRDDRGNAHCCDDACTAGCYGDGEDKCVACKHYEEDGRCVATCRGNSAYNSSTLIREPLPKGQRRFFYEKHCVRECPPNTLLEEDRYCVTRCSPGNYRDHLTGDRCVPCEGPCPKVCTMNERIDAITIRRLVNCSEIEGNLEFVNHVFTNHSPDVIDLKRPDAQIPALHAKDLNALKSVRIVTGFVAFDGGRITGPNRLRSLDFLENLETIEGRNLYFDKFSLYISGHPDLHTLGLKSLRKIRHGAISFRQNENLCYGRNIPFKRRYGVVDAIWGGNMDESRCQRAGRVCDQTCLPEMGCWGQGAAQCVVCRHFIKDGICSDSCPTWNGYYIPDSSNHSAAGRRCELCAEECTECFGPGADQCTKCRAFALRSSNGGPLKCVRDCPKGTFPSGDECVSCDPVCLLYESEDSGCTGAGTHFGPGGCNTCQFAVEKRKGKIECLMGDETNACAVNNLTDHHLALAPAQFHSQLRFLCQKCPDECSSCHQPTTDTRYCSCAAYSLFPNSITAANDSEVETRVNCVLECGKGTFIAVEKQSNGTGVCERCHPLCDPEVHCHGPKSTQCGMCLFGGIVLDSGEVECLSECPDELPYAYRGLCHDTDLDAEENRKQNMMIGVGCFIGLIILFTIGFFASRCVKYRKKYVEEQKLHLPEMPALDPRKMTHRPNMRRLNLISVDELDEGKRQSKVLGQGAFGIVYVGKWRPPGRNIGIPVAIKAINPAETRHVTEAEMMKEAGIMAAVDHEHLLPLVGLCVAKGGIKIVTILRPLGSLLKFLGEHRNTLCAKQMVLYCYQITSAMEFLARKKIIHRDLAARNILVRNINHVEVTDFGLAQMLQGSETVVVLEGRVAVKWLAIESLLDQIYTERTDVWAFGVTCWEILTFGETPYRELQLPKDHNFARELADKLEKGYRLRQPHNCSQELYQELLNCWLIDPDSRPTFRQLKERFDTFCRAPHLYVQDRQAAQHMDSISESEQRAMIERLLQDSDFVNPLSLDPTDYGNTVGSVGTSGRVQSTRPSNTTVETFIPDTPTTLNFSGNPLTGRSNGRIRNPDSLHEPVPEELDMDDENYLMPRVLREQQGLVYTPVVGAEKTPNNGSPTHEYSNDPSQQLLHYKNTAPPPPAADEPSVHNYVNQSSPTRDKETGVLQTETAF